MMRDIISALPHSRTLRQLGNIACAAMFLAACSSGGGGGGGGTSPAASSSSGTFVDSPVQGLGYKALPSGLTGQTDATGQYQFMPGDMVTFNLGGRPIGMSVTAGQQVTALSIFGATSTTDPSLVNLSRLLLTLGGPPNNNNVIVLPSPLPANLPQTLPNFSDQTLTFATQLQTAGFQLTVSDTQALAHLQTSFKTLAVTVFNSGTVTSNPAGINCTAAGTCSFAFVTDTVVTLTATGNGFTGWSGPAGCLGIGTCPVTMSADAAVTARFPGTPPPAMLTILLNQGTGTGTGSVACRANGGAFGACATSYASGTVLVLQATANTDSTFTGWTNGTGNAVVCNNTFVDCSIPSLNADSAVTANFVLNTQTFTLSTNTTTSNGGGGSIACSTTGGASFEACALSYNAGTILTLQATPDSASNFTGWSASVCSGTGPCQFALAANSSIAANFNRPRLTVVLVGTGTVTSTNIAGINCGPTCTAPFDTNTSITLAANGTGFSSWSGGCSGTSSTCVVILTADTTVTASFVPTSSGYVYPLTIGPTSRYLVDQNSKPFLLVGDAAWSLFAALSDSDADVYLQNRQQLGFTAVLASLIEHKFAASAPADSYGFTPFTGQTFTTPNDAYFAHVDYIVQSAAAKGIVILLDPLYLGFNCGDEGWCAEVQAATTLDMTAWGQYVGNRYKNFDNIVWVIGGDTDPTQVKTNVQAVVDGILSRDTRHLFTAHNARGSMAIDPWVGAGWLNVNNTYTGGGVIDYQAALTAYTISPAKPFFLIESNYENEHGVTSQELRAQSYWTVLSGGFGHVFGNCPIWGFGFASSCDSPSTDWNAALNSVGSMNMQHFQALFNSRHWHSLVPDTSVLTGGSGTLGDPDYATAAAAADGSSIIAYLPPSTRTVTVNGASLAGSTMTAWWYNPGTGVATQFGTNLTTGTQSFTPPSSSDDWVLVLDSTTASFPPPGSN